MDTLRGNFGHDAAFGEDAYVDDPTEDDTGREAPPASIGTDERRMQVRAYNHWASLLQGRDFPCVEDFDPEDLPDFGPYSVLLDFTAGIEDPVITFLGAELAEECGADAAITHLNDVPRRSMLSRITDHYMQILANQAPIGFEVEFVNQQGRTALYRGILLPYSSDNDTIDFIHGVINWKELADQLATDELLLEIGQALEQKVAEPPTQRNAQLLNNWADGPLGDAEDEDPEDHEEDDEDGDDEVYDLSALIRIGSSSTAKRSALPNPVFGSLDEDPAATAMPVAADDGPLPRSMAPAYPLPAETIIELAMPDEAGMGLGDWLASARELALAASSSEDRTRQTLYAAIGRAYDFSLAAAEAPEDYAELVADCGLTMQDRAPMTPVVKLVFGAGYDKTRLTEYSAALGHAHRFGIPRGQLSDYIASTDGGLKGVVAAERRLRREESGKVARLAIGPDTGPREQLARKLRSREPLGFDAIAPEGPEFALVMIRRMPDGAVTMLGEVPGDTGLIERAARKLLA